MTRKSKIDVDFDIRYSQKNELHSLFKFAMALILESDNPQNLPLVITNPSKPDYYMMNLQETHCLIFRIIDTDKIEFVYCN